MSMRVAHIGNGRFRARPTSAAEQAIHISKYPPRPLHELPTLVMPRRPEAGVVGARMAVAAAYPSIGGVLSPVK